jgi:hypothetical protein
MALCSVRDEEFNHVAFLVNKFLTPSAFPGSAGSYCIPMFRSIDKEISGNTGGNRKSHKITGLLARISRRG